MKEQVAQLNYLKIAPRKVRLLADTIRGLSVSEAEAQLLSRPERAGGPLLKLLRSAVANARNNQKLNPERLSIIRISVDKGPMLKRALPRAQGRTTPIHKIMSHVTLTLGESEKNLGKRFTITPPPKKEKKEKPKKSGPKPKTPENKESPKTKDKNVGFFKKMFQRKSV